MNTITLYRPVGLKEMELIAESDFTKFPPRLEWQPIFYPVLNEKYAIEIASQWNTNDEFGNFLGIVTEFEVLESEVAKYVVQNVGGNHHNELWVPAEELLNFNAAIQGKIKITKVFKGENFVKTDSKVLKDLLNFIDK